MGVGTSGSILPTDFCKAVRIAEPSESSWAGPRKKKVPCESFHCALNAKADVRKLTARLGSLLEDEQLATRLLEIEMYADGYKSAPALAALVTLAEQSITMGIDYLSLGLGWHHPMSRMEYRSGSHDSQTAKASRNRAMASREYISKAVAAVLRRETDMESTVTKEFIREIGLSSNSAPAIAASFSGVSAALNAELLLPLRALNEGLLAKNVEVTTGNGDILAKQELRVTLEALMGAVLSRPGAFSEWRYSNAVGMEQLRGLSGPQQRQWQHAFSMSHEVSRLRTHEDDPSELGFFWTTKIGGPSHGFDFEGHCVLPLLANARHKAIFVDDPQWKHFPAGRAHWRLLWTAGDSSPNSEPRLWLEAVHRDLSAEQHGIGVELQYVAWLKAVLRHAMAKAEAMHVVLSINVQIDALLRELYASSNKGGRVYTTEERMLLRPSNGVIEASDELGSKHDWVQQTEEVTESLQRTLYVPPVVGGNVAEPSSDRFAYLQNLGPALRTLGRRSRMGTCL